MRRFFFNPNLAQLSSESSMTTSTPVSLSQLAIGSLLKLTDDIYHHWCRVLRAKIGEQSLIFDGLGGQSVI